MVRSIFAGVALVALSATNAVAHLTGQASHDDGHSVSVGLAAALCVLVVVAGIRWRGRQK